MGIGISIFIGAVGAILRYAVTGSSNQQGFDIHTGGVILMFVGGLGLVLSVLLGNSATPFGRRDRSVSRREETVTQDGRVINETRDHLAS